MADINISISEKAYQRITNELNKRMQEDTTKFLSILNTDGEIWTKYKQAIKEAANKRGEDWFPQKISQGLYARAELGYSEEHFSRTINEILKKGVTSEFATTLSRKWGKLPEYWQGLTDYETNEQKNESIRGEEQKRYNAIITYLASIGYDIAPALYCRVYADELDIVIPYIAEYTTKEEINRARHEVEMELQSYEGDREYIAAEITLYNKPEWMVFNQSKAKNNKEQSHLPLLEYSEERQQAELLYCFYLSDLQEISEKYGQVESYINIEYIITHNGYSSTISTLDLDDFCRHFESISAAFASSFLEEKSFPL